MNSKLYFFSVIILAAGLGLQGCTSKANNERPAALQKAAPQTVTVTHKSIKEIGLTTFTVVQRPLTGEVSAPATVVPDQNLEALIGSPVQGRIHKVFVNIGDAVAAGQVVMSVEGLDVGAIKANYVKAKAAHDFARAAYERQKKLFEEKAGSQKALLEVQAEYEKARAEYTAEDKKIHSVGLTDEDVADGKEGREHSSGTLQIKTPVGGVVVERNVVVGQYVDAATNALRVMDTRTVWIDGQIHEKDLAKVDRKTTVIFSTAAYPNETMTGRIINIGQVIDAQSRTVTVRAEFPNPLHRLKPQMFGQLHIPIGGNGNALFVPEESVVREAGASYVFVQTGDTTFEKRSVAVGISVKAMIEIQKGVKEGETIAAKGVYYLKGDLKKDELSGEEN
jgi:cobalt-zinc-cadmium efflux system membrane fusion protein